MTDKIVETIKKLLAKGQGTDNAHEAAAFMAKAQALMAEHGVDQTAIDLADVGDVFVRSRFSVSVVKSYENRLLHVICRAFGCQLLWHRAASGSKDYARFRLIGQRDQVKLADYAAVTLLRALERSRAAYSRELGFKPLTRKQITQRADSFCEGWVYEVAKTVQVFAAPSAAVELRTKQLLGDNGEAKVQQRPIDGRAIADGLKAGRDQRLHRPMTGEERRQLTGAAA